MEILKVKPQTAKNTGRKIERSKTPIKKPENKNQTEQTKSAKDKTKFFNSLVHV